MHRLFVGLRPPPETRWKLLAMMGGIHGARWQVDEQLHLTLRFVGEVARPMAEDVAAALGQIHFPALDLRLQGVGQFEDSRGRVNAVWAGVAPHDEVTRLHHKVDSALRSIGVAPDKRAFLPHITLARLNVPKEATERFIADHAGFSSAPFRCEYLILWESILGGERALYESVARYPLE